MENPARVVPNLDHTLSAESVIKQLELSGVNLGDNPQATIESFVEAGLLPKSNNGYFPSWVVQRIIAIQDQLAEGKTTEELKQEIAKERRKFLSQATDLNSMVRVYQKFSSNSFFTFFTSLGVLILLSGLITLSIFDPKNPVLVAGENTVGAAVVAGKNAARIAVAPLGQTMVTIIKASKPEDTKSSDPLGLTNIEKEKLIIPENILQLDGSGNLNIGKGGIFAESFKGSGENITNIQAGEIVGVLGFSKLPWTEISSNFLAGSGLAISLDATTNGITFANTDLGSSQFIFKNIAVSSQSSIISDLNNDSLTIVAGSNITLTTDANTDTLTISASGGSTNADTLDSIDSTAFAVLLDNETIGGNWTFNSTNARPILIQPAFWPGTSTSMFEVRNEFAGTEFLVDYEGDVTAGDITGVIINATSGLRTSGSVRLDAFGALWNITTISASSTVDIGGATTITDDLTIGDGVTLGDQLTVRSSGVSSAISTTKDSNRILLQGTYWDGGASQTVEMQIMNNVLDTTPTHSISFLRGPGVEIARFESDGDAVIYGDLQVIGGDILSSASQLIIQAAGANADVVVQGGLCIRNATACPDVAAGGLQVDTAGSVGDDPGDVFDIAEYYPASEDVQPGDVLTIDANSAKTVKKSTHAYDSKLIGIVSTSPAVVIEENFFSVGAGISQFYSRKPYVALVGRVPTKVSTENGAIQPGDNLTSSSTPGVAMKATQSGPTIGKALESFTCDKDGPCQGKVMVFVSTGYSINFNETPTYTLQNNSNYITDFISKTGEAVFSKVNATIANFSKLIFGELVVQKSAKSAGQSTLLGGQNEIFIQSDKVRSDSLINLTPDSEPDGVLYVKEKRTGEGFVVGVRRIDQTSAKEIKFSWFILNQE